jgi:hypothetical protein
MSPTSMKYSSVLLIDIILLFDALNDVMGFNLLSMYIIYMSKSYHRRENKSVYM